MDHTGFTLQTTPYLPLPCERSPDGATWTADIWFSSLLIYRPRNDERLSWPSWLIYSGRDTHISGHTSATDRAEVRESSPVRDRRSNHWATQPTYWGIQKRRSAPPYQIMWFSDDFTVKIMLSSVCLQLSVHYNPLTNVMGCYRRWQPILQSPMSTTSAGTTVRDLMSVTLKLT